jgi:hypothetical protein
MRMRVDEIYSFVGCKPQTLQEYDPERGEFSQAVFLSHRNQTSASPRLGGENPTVSTEQNQNTIRGDSRLT